MSRKYTSFVLVLLKKVIFFVIQEERSLELKDYLSIIYGF